MLLRSSIIGITCAIISTHSFANEQVKTLSTLPSSPAYLIKLVLGLIAVIGLFAALAWLVRRFGIGGFAHSSTGELKILETISVGSRERLIIVQAGEDKLLLGITAGQINKLHSMNSNTKNKTNFEDHLTKQRKLV